MDPSVTLSVLRELGVLFEAPGASNPPEDGEALAPAPPLPADADHHFLAHAPLWDYEDPLYARPFADPAARPLFCSLPPGAGVGQALAHTRLLAFLGAAATPALLSALDEPGCLLLVFETDPGRAAQFARAVGPKRLAGRCHLFLGRCRDFLPPLSQVLPPTLFQPGFPVFFALPGRDSDAENDTDTVRLLELLFYRHRLYPLSGQANSRGLPLRPMTRGLFYDQQRHALANVAAMALAPDLSQLKRAFAGETAILVAAGPDLPARLEYIRLHREHALVIAVNNALRPLLAAGIKPHLVVANDTSVLTARSWEGLPKLPDVALVAHSLTDLGGDVFPTRFLFGTYRPELFGPRANLRLHGSVITTAFSLARHLGCARCVLAGAQLCSDNPWSLSYARGSIHESAAPAQDRPLTQAFPQLVPAHNGLGDPLYTSLNFLDAAVWLLDEIRATGVPCVNLTRESLLHGPGIDYDPDHAPAPTGQLSRRLRQVFAMRGRPRGLAPLLDELTRELGGWRIIADASGRLAQGREPDGLARGLALMERFDQNNVSYLVQRFADFDNARFHAEVLGPGAADPVRREAGLRYFYGYVERMAAGLAEILAGQIRRLQEALADGGRP